MKAFSALDLHCEAALLSANPRASKRAGKNVFPARFDL